MDTPEFRLLYSVLLTTIMDVFRDSAPQKVRDDAVLWILGRGPYANKDYRRHLFSFTSICHILEVDPNMMRARLHHALAEDIC